MTPRVREILSWCGADSAGTLTNLARRSSISLVTSRPWDLGCSTTLRAAPVRSSGHPTVSPASNSSSVMPCQAPPICSSSSPSSAIANPILRSIEWNDSAGRGWRRERRLPFSSARAVQLERDYKMKDDILRRAPARRSLWDGSPLRPATLLLLAIRRAGEIR